MTSPSPAFHDSRAHQILLGMNFNVGAQDGAEFFLWLCDEQHYFGDAEWGPYCHSILTCRLLNQPIAA